jgi:hypothetical protein
MIRSGMCAAFINQSTFWQGDPKINSPVNFDSGLSAFSWYIFLLSGHPFLYESA